jgi:hypothetical protein
MAADEGASCLPAGHPQPGEGERRPEWVEEMKLAEVTVAVSVWANVCGPTWDGLRRLVMGLQQERWSALALELLLETAAALIGGVGWTWMEYCTNCRQASG